MLNKPYTTSYADHHHHRHLQASVTSADPAMGNTHQPTSRSTNHHNQVIQAARNLQFIQARSSSQYTPSTNAYAFQGPCSTGQNDLLVQMYNWQVNLTAQLQAAYARLQTTQSQLEAAQSTAQKTVLSMQSMQARIAELEEEVKSKSVVEHSRRMTSVQAIPMHGNDDGPSHGNHRLKRSNRIPAFDFVAGYRCGEGETYSASESSDSSLGTPGPTVFDGSPSFSLNHNVAGTRTLVTPQTTPQNSTPEAMSPKAISTLQASPDVTGAKRSSHLVGQLSFRERLTDLFQLTASFAQLYTNKPNSLMRGAVNIDQIMDLAMTKDSDFVHSLMSKQDTRCGLVTRIMNQFMTRHVLFYEVVRGFNTSTDSEIRQFLEHLYSDTPGLVRSLFYTHLANQVLGLRSSASFAPQFQARQSSNANTLYSIISPFVMESPSLAPHPQCQSMRVDFLAIIQTAHNLALDMISGAYEFSPFWPSTGERFDSEWMVNRDAGIIGHKVKARKEGIIKLATSPAICFTDHTKADNDRGEEMLLRANVILQPDDETSY